jgi:Rod binding domain-containing protein
MNVRAIGTNGGLMGEVSSASSERSLAENAKLRKAALDFEGLLLAQMLQSIRESALGGWQEHHDQGGAVALEMAETQMAQVLALQGGLGIARTLTESMGRREAKPAPTQADGAVESAS